jgi:hypothetical protein
MDLQDWLLRDGHVVEAAGRVVAGAGEVRFESWKYKRIQDN